MEQETNFFHLFTQHQFIIFVIVSLLILGAFVGILALLGRRAERRTKGGVQNETRR